MKNFLFALRYLRKLRGGTVARVISLSLGLAVGLLIFSYANYNLTSDRCFRDGQRAGSAAVYRTVFRMCNG